LIDTQTNVYEALKDTPILPELSFTPPSLDFIVSSQEEVLYPLILDSDVIIIGGAYFGDEGKGKITDAVAGHPLITMIARMNSGENAGHTVSRNGKRYVFHLTPSGIMIPDKICLIGPECVMDPINFMEKEIKLLADAGEDYKKKLFVGDVHIVGPHHKILDFALSAANSSTLMGMSYVHASKVMKKGLRLDHLFNGDVQKRRIEGELEIYRGFMKQAGKDERQVLEELIQFAKTRKIPHHLFEFLEAKDKTAYIIDLYMKNVVNNEMFPERRDANRMINDALGRGEKALIESPQSFWLSNATEKHWTSSTSAQTHAAGVLASTRINPSRYRIMVINVAKTPADSRVGIGSNPSSFVPQDHFSKQKISSLDDLGDACTDFDAIQRSYFGSIQKNGILKPVMYKDATGEYSISSAMAASSSRLFGEKGATTGKPRVTGIFDCVAARQVNDAQGPYLSISAVDRGDFQDHVGMTVAYIFHKMDGSHEADCNGKTYRNGDIIRIGDPYPCDNVLKHCHPIVKVMRGWKDTPIAAGKRNPSDTLPDAVQEFLSAVEHFTGFKVISIGNGPNTKDMIYLGRKDAGRKAAN